MVSGPERIAAVANAIDVIEQLADRGAPGACASQRVVRSQLKAAGEAVLHQERDTVVARTVVGTKQRDVRQSRRQRDPADVLIAPVLVDALVMLVVHVDAPRVAERALESRSEERRVGKEHRWGWATYESS